MKYILSLCIAASFLCPSYGDGVDIDTAYKKALEAMSKSHEVEADVAALNAKMAIIQRRQQETEERLQRLEDEKTQTPTVQEPESTPIKAESAKTRKVCTDAGCFIIPIDAPDPPSETGGWRFDNKLFGVNGSTGWYTYGPADDTTLYKAPAAQIQQIGSNTNFGSAGGHSHQCSDCGRIWSHANGDPNASHNCPRCGKFENVILSGSMSGPNIPMPAIRQQPIRFRPSFPVGGIPFGGGFGVSNCSS